MPPAMPHSLDQPSITEPLRRVSKPARYTGGEWGSIHKPWEEASVRICLAYPNTYESSVLRPSVNSVYSTLNALPDVLMERVFAPWPDLVVTLRTSGETLRSLESQRPVGQFDVVAMCYPDELSGPTILEMLDLAGVPIDAIERERPHPLVVGWEEEPRNPEPLVPFLDAYLLGDVETAMTGVIGTLREHSGTELNGRPARQEILSELARQPGIYVPRADDADVGTARAGQPIKKVGASEVIKRVAWQDLDPAPLGYVVPHLQAMPDRPTIEVSRGCSPDCEWHRLGLHLGSSRSRATETVIEALRGMVRSTGFQEVAIGGTCLHDRADGVPLVRAAGNASREARAHLRLPPLAPTVGSAKIIQMLQDEKQNITIGPIAIGAQSDREWQEAVAGAIADGSARDVLGNVRVTVVLGHPKATIDATVRDQAELARWIRLLPATRGQLRVEISFFVPRAFTPMERAPQLDRAGLVDQATALKGAFGRKVSVSPTREGEVAQVEAAIARGGREVSKVILQAWELGQYLEGATDPGREDLWRLAFDRAGVDLEKGATRSFLETEPLPWDHLED